MAYSFYNQLPKLKDRLLLKGYEKDIPYEIFGTELMIMFGMKKRTAGEWIRNFVTVGLITMDQQRRINFT